MVTLVADGENTEPRLSLEKGGFMKYGHLLTEVLPIGDEDVNT